MSNDVPSENVADVVGRLYKVKFDPGDRSATLTCLSSGTSLFTYLQKLQVLESVTIRCVNDWVLVHFTKYTSRIPTYVMHTGAQETEDALEALQKDIHVKSIKTENKQ